MYRTWPVQAELGEAGTKEMFIEVDLIDRGKVKELSTSWQRFRRPTDILALPTSLQQRPRRPGETTTTTTGLASWLLSLHSNSHISS